MRTLAWYGVGFFADWWHPFDSVAEEDQDLLEVELQASRRDPTDSSAACFTSWGFGSRGSSPTRSEVPSTARSLLVVSDVRC
jgi:hypothetical protein